MKSLMSRFRFVPLLGGVLLPACGSVEVGEEHFYRLSPPPVSKADGPGSGVIRVEDFSVSPHLQGQRLIATFRGNEVASYRYHLWAAPLEKLITDSLYRGFLHSGRFKAVIDARDRAEADWSLSGRILDFQEVGEGGDWKGHVQIAFLLRDEKRGKTLWQGRLSAKVEARGPEPEPVVEALSRAMGRVRENVAALADEMRNLENLTLTPGK